MKVFVAVPAYNGDINAQTARALATEVTLAHMAGVDMQIAFVTGQSLVTMARNHLARQFLESGADRLVFVDSDVSWMGGELLRVALHPVDVVGACYRVKRAEEEYRVQWLPKAELWADPQTGLIEVGGLPGGFLAISRAALLRIQEAKPRRWYRTEGGRFFGFFENQLVEAAEDGGDGEMRGEDIGFCMLWRSVGGQVWLDPEVALSHHGGQHEYAGHIGNWLRGRA